MQILSPYIKTRETNLSVETAGAQHSSLLLHRLINTTTEDLLPESQCGFGKNRSRMDMIIIARQLQEKSRKHKQDLFMAFVDLSKAFDISHTLKSSREPAAGA